MFKQWLILVLIFEAVFLTACSSAYRSPIDRSQLPPHWQQHSVPTTKIATMVQASQPWWHNFRDSRLNRLIEQALLVNNNLAVATLKVYRARLQAALTRTNLVPEGSVTIRDSLNRNLKFTSTTQTASIGGELSYELDLWGKLANLRAVDRWEALATEADRQSTALSLVGTVATLYWQIVYLNQRIQLSQASLTCFQKIAQLTEEKYRAGAASQLEWLQAQQNITSHQTALAGFQQELITNQNALAILFDQLPESEMKIGEQDLSVLTKSLPSIAVGIPAQILQRRPDLQAAEFRLRGYYANAEASRRTFYPTFTLTGELGSSSDSLLRVLHNPVATLGAGLALPFVQWRTAKFTTQLAQAKYREAVISFRQTLYQALSEVENALAVYARYRRDGINLVAATQRAGRLEGLKAFRYHQGEVDRIEWLEAQESQRTTQIQLLENQLNQLKARLKLYQALGGD